MGKRKYPKITGLRFTPKTISFKMDGKKVRDRIEVSSRVAEVGHFSIHKPLVRVDKRIKSNGERRSIALHEAVEREERRRGKGPLQAHHIAEGTEYRMRHRTGTNWRKEGKDVDRVFRENRTPGVRRKK